MKRPLALTMKTKKTYTMEIENDANVTENQHESVLNGSKRSSILSPSLLFNMFLEKYSDVKTRRHNQPRIGGHSRREAKRKDLVEA